MALSVRPQNTFWEKVTALVLICFLKEALNFLKQFLKPEGHSLKVKKEG